MTDWCPDLSRSTAPRYLAIADAIAADLAAGRLADGNRLPAQRQLAARLDLDFTTVARGYAEARRRGLITARVGSGSFVTAPDVASAPSASLPSQEPRRNPAPDFSMNLPPEPDDPVLLAHLRQGFGRISADLPALLRYQTPDADGPDRQMAVRWLRDAGLSPAPQSVQFAAGAQAALAGIVSILARPGDRIACEAVTYAGIRSLCSQMGLRLTGLPVDADGVDPDAFRSACSIGDLAALYLNPTLQNPTTRTIPVARRKALAAIARQYGVPIIEDDAYGALCRNSPLPFAAIAPDVTWYIGTLSKALGAGLRLAHVIAPDRSGTWQLARATRTASVMVSPITMALSTRWIEDGTARMLRDHIRMECVARQALTKTHLGDARYESDPEGFHVWLHLDNGWTASAFANQIRSLPVGVVEAEAFTACGPPPNAVRLCLGGPASRDQVDGALDVIAETLATAPERASAFF
ncbi:PLP-dependent aminotransferase family protein [Labrenzia sp. 011]|uniref:aminotransferase-like domain-containing protein n=1 Tax=Labrenzia sp. 011 TaxID=2171494 RepID=UPI000D5163FA|nr:PLP-dependent aminotransferase family protein [Labrenzia sp. 011]PVB63409.1 GntR family transcriptional regulator [Labrenzia sp. 011]